MESTASVTPVGQDHSSLSPSFPSPFRTGDGKWKKVACVLTWKNTETSRVHHPRRRHLSSQVKRSPLPLRILKGGKKSEKAKMMFASWQFQAALEKEEDFDRQFFRCHFFLPPSPRWVILRGVLLFVACAFSTFTQMSCEGVAIYYLFSSLSSAVGVSPPT